MEDTLPENTPIVSIPEEVVAQYLTERAAARRSLHSVAVQRANDEIAKWQLESQGPTNHENITIHFPLASQTILERALGEMGKPYQYTAYGPYAYDCSGLCGYAVTGRYQRLFTTSDVVVQQNKFPWVTIPRPGDIVIVDNSNWRHCGIYYSLAKYIQAGSSVVGEGYYDVEEMRFCRYIGQ